MKSKAQNYAVVKIGGSQHKVAEGDELVVDKIEGKKGEKIEFDQILLWVRGRKVKIGQPFVEKIKAQAEILDQLKGEKLRVATYKAKSRYRRVRGFRPLLTKIRIKKITSS